MNRNLLLLCLFGLIGFAACAAPTPEKPTATVEAPTATVAAATSTPPPTTTTQPIPTDTLTPTVTPMPIVAPDYVWLDKDGLVIYSRDGNLCMKDGDADPVYLMSADANKYYFQLLNNPPTVMLFGRHVNPEGDPYFPSHYDDIWSIDRQTGEVVYLASTLDILKQRDVEQIRPIQAMYQVPGSNTYVFFTGESDSYSMDLFRLDKNGQLTTLLELGELASGFEVSPDGQHIAFVMRDLGVDREFDGIGLIDVDGGNYRPRIITYHMITSYGKMSIMPHPVWREDSAGFWIAIPPPYRDKLPNIMTTWYVPVDGEPVQLGSFERPLGFIYAATFSPDGRYVAYVAVDNKELLLEPGIHIMRSDGSDDAVYFNANYSDYFYYWEDNTHFIFGTWADRIRSTYRGGIGEEPVLIETFDLDAEEPIIPIPAEGCEP